VNSTNAGIRENRIYDKRAPRVVKSRAETLVKASSRSMSNDGATHIVSAFLHLLQGDALDAKKHLMAARRAAMRANNEQLLYLCMASEACLAAQQADTVAVHACLARATDLAPVSGAERGARLPHILAEKYVALSLLRRNHSAESADGARTAVPLVRIETVGRFGVSIGDQNLNLALIRQKKPLELLKALIALGGREVQAVRLHEMLWPDADGDAAHRCLTVALHRLRRIVGADFITFHSGRLSLDPRRCRVDVWDVERQFCCLEALQPNDSVAEFSAGVHQLMTLYRRPFLEGEEAHWVISMRERLREKFLRVLVQAARALHRAGLHAEVLDCCQKGIEIDPLAEELYRLRLCSQHELGQVAAAIATYRLCEVTLQRELGIAPSPTTEAMYQQALGRGQT